MSSVVSILIIEMSEPADGLVQDLVAFLERRGDCQIRTPLLLHNPEDRIGQRLMFPGLELRIKEQAVYRNNELIPLSHYEFFTLYYLAKHLGWVFSKKQIYEAVWKDPGEDCGAAVSNVICQLRRKLWPENPKGGYIKTVHNSGYKFEV